MSSSEDGSKGIIPLDFTQHTFEDTGIQIEGKYGIFLLHRAFMKKDWDGTSRNGNTIALKAGERYLELHLDPEAQEVTPETLQESLVALQQLFTQEPELQSRRLIGFTSASFLRLLNRQSDHRFGKLFDIVDHDLPTERVQFLEYGYGKLRPGTQHGKIVLCTQTAQAILAS